MFEIDVSALIQNMAVIGFDYFRWGGLLFCGQGVGSNVSAMVFCLIVNHSSDTHGKILVHKVVYMTYFAWRHQGGLHNEKQCPES